MEKIETAIVICICFLVIVVLAICLHDKSTYYSRLCETLNGTPCVYALDQPEWLCELPDGRIIDLRTAEEVNITELLK